MLETQPFASATALMRGQILPPSEMKSLYGSTTKRALMLLSYVEVFMVFAPAVVGATFFALGAICADALCDRSEFAVIATVKFTKVRLSISLAPQWSAGAGWRDRLVYDRAPHPLKLHHHSGSVLFPLRKRRPVQVHLECGGVPVHFVDAD